uniref:Uncharacterized protein n=1 Tax=Trichogramma kaykai TaxID=54128 RepID=A0ABD2WC41_9HYME
MCTAVTSRPAACAHRRLLYVRAMIQEPGEFRIRRAKPYRPPGDHCMRDTYEPRYSARLAAADVDSQVHLGTRSIGACAARDRPAARDHLIRIANKAPQCV